MDKEQLKVIQEIIIKHLDENIYPKLEILTIRKLNDTLEIEIHRETQRYFAERNHQLHETLVKIIGLLAEPKS